jgi:uncharacterized membrane protein YkvI
MGAEIKQPTFLCLVTSFVIAVTIGVILSAVSSDKSCYVYDLPLFHILNEAKIFRFLAAGGMFTSLISSFYPLYDFAAKRGKVFGKCLLVVFTLAFSIVPFQTIVSSVYPSIGVAGIALTAICTAVYLHNKGYAVKRKKKFYYKNRKRFYCHKRKKVI